MPPEPAQGTNAPIQLAVFDLDGTVTRHDTLFPYVLGFLWRRPGRLPHLVRFVPAVLRFLFRHADHGELKSALIRCTLGGSSRAEIDAWTEVFVRRLNRRGMLADALARITQHRADGVRLVLLSASTDLYVPVLARALGFDQVICTGVRWHGDRLDGHLTTPNRRGAEKVRCFTSLREDHPGLVTAAYANSASDLAHLQLADRPLLVNAAPRARHMARQLGIPCTQWH